MSGSLVQKQHLSLWMVIFLSTALMMLASAAVAAPGGKKGKGPKPVGAVNSSNGGVYSPGEYGIIFKYITFQQDSMYRGSDEVSFMRPGMGQKPGKKVYEKRLDRYQLTLRTGIWKDFDVRLIVPYMDKELKRQSFKASFSDDNAGFGDITLFSRYRIMSQKNKDPFNLAVGLGLEIPTGKTDVKDSSGMTPGYLQPGGGSWNPAVEVGAHKVTGPHWIGSHILYKMTNEGELGDRDFERPDVFKYNFSYGYALAGSFDLQLELNGEVKSKAKLDGKTMPNSGGHCLFITPGIHYKIMKGMHVGLALPVTVYRDLNGEQPSEDYRVVAKFAMKF